MRRVLLVGLVLLSGCADFWAWREKRIEAATQERLAEEWKQVAYRNSPEGQAAATCQTKVAFAMAGNPIRGALDVAGVVREQQLQAMCMEQWRRTGQFP